MLIKVKQKRTIEEEVEVNVDLPLFFRQDDMDFIRYKMVMEDRIISLTMHKGRADITINTRMVPFTYDVLVSLQYNTKITQADYAEAAKQIATSIGLSSWEVK